MSKKRVLQFILTFFFFIYLVPYSGAQDGGISLSTNRNGRRYIQRLVWVGDEYTLRYEILVEKEEEGSYTRVSRVFTGESFIELPLQPGNYRCRVIPHDFLDRPGEGSEWMIFEIPAFVENEAPEPDTGSFIAEIEQEPESETETLEPAKKEKPFDFYLGAAWMPVFSVYGEFDQFSDWHNTLYSGGIRFGIVSFTSHSIDFGLELAISWYNFYSTFYSYSFGYEGKIGYLEAFELNLLAQKWFPKKIVALNLRAGGGYLSLKKTIDDNIVPSADLDSYYLDIGFSFLLRPGKYFYMETGIDYIHLPTQESFGLLRPWAGIGVRF